MTFGVGSFGHCTGLTNVVFPDSITTIGSNAFYGCSGLTAVTFGTGLTSINTSAFNNCSGLEMIVCNATTAPSIVSNSFQNIKTGGVLIVPVGSTGYDVWMGTGNYYLGKYNWAKVEL